ncbi:MAG: tetratricopeptide repeat protein [Deltaproteobacteria bacterium]
MAPLATWRGTEQRIVALRLLHATGAPRRSSLMAISTYRGDRSHGGAAFWMGVEMLRRRGPLSTLEFLRRREWPTQDWRILEARILVQLRDFEGADRALRAAEELRPGDPRCLAERATLLEAQDRYAEALAIAREALSAAPDSVLALHVVARLLQLQNRDGVALELLSGAVQRLQAASLASHLALVQKDLDLHAESRASYERVVELSPEMERGFAQWLCAARSDAAFLCGDLDAAIELARASQNPFHLAVAPRMEAHPQGRRVRLPVRFVRQHHMTCAPATLSAIADLWGVHVDHLEVAERICYDGTSNHSERRWAEQNGFRARDFTVTWEAAKALLDRGIPFTLATYEPGSAHLQAVIGYDERRGVLLVRDPFVPTLVEIDAHEGLKRWATTGPRGLALAPLSKSEALDALELADSAERDLLFAVDSALQAHDRPAAERAVRQLVERSPRHPVAIHARRALASYDGDHQQLLECADALLDLFPSDLNLLLARAASLRQLGRRAAWLECLEARSRRVREGDPVIWIELASDLRRDARRHTEATALLRRAIRFRPVAAAAWHLLADLRWDERRYEEALALYRFASCLDDKDEGHATSWFLAARVLDRSDEALRRLRERFERFAAQSSQPASTLFRALDTLHRQVEALAVLDEALALRPDDFGLLLFSATQNARLGQPGKARTLLDRAAGMSRGAPWHRAAAAVAEQGSQLQEALEHWRTVLATEPLAVDAHDSVARLLAQTGGEDAAVAHLRSACERFPHHYQLRQMWLNRLRDGDPAAALEVARALVDHHPSDGWARRELAVLLQQTGQAADAWAQLDVATQIEPRDPNTLNVRGALLEQAQRVEEAREQYRESLRLAVDQPWTLGALLRACAGAGERRRELEFVRGQLLEQAVPGGAPVDFQREAVGVLADDEILAALQAVREASPDTWQAWSAAVQQLSRMARSDDALVLAQAAADRFPLMPGALLDLAAVHGQRKETPLQKAALQKALLLSPGWSEAARQLVELYEKELDFAAAKELVEHAAAAAPFSAVVHAYLAEILFRSGEKGKAIEQLLRALELEPDFPWAWERLREWGGDSAGFARRLAASKPWSVPVWLAVARNAGDLAESLEALVQAEKREPRRIGIHDLRAMLLAEAGRLDEARAACAPSALGNPAPVALRSRAAWILARRGDRKGAIQEMRALCAEERSWEPGLWQLVELCREEKDGPGMLEAAMQGAALKPQSAPFHAAVAEASLRLGRRSEAKAALRRACDLDPAHGWAAPTLFDELLADGALEEAAAVLARIDARAPSAYVAARKVQLAARRKEQALARSALAEVCAATDANDWPVRSAAEVVAAAGWGRMLENVLSSALRAPVCHPEVGRAWMRHVGARSWLPRLWRELAGLQACGPAGVRAIEEYLNGNYRSATLFIARRGETLRGNLALWAAAGYALTSRRRYRAASRWLADYRARSPEPWMMLNVVASLHGDRRYADADEALEFALSLPGATDERNLRLWNGFRLALAGSVPPPEPAPAEDFWVFLHRITRAVAASSSDAADRKAAFRESRRLVHVALAPYFNRWLPSLHRAVLARAARRIAEARGGSLAALWAWSKRVRR